MDLITLVANNAENIPHFPIKINSDYQYEIALKSQADLQYVTLHSNWTSLKKATAIVNGTIIHLDRDIYTPVTLCKEFNKKQTEVKFEYLPKINKIQVYALNEETLEIIFEKRIWAAFEFENFKLLANVLVEQTIDKIIEEKIIAAINKKEAEKANERKIRSVIEEETPTQKTNSQLENEDLSQTPTHPKQVIQSENLKGNKNIIFSGTPLKSTNEKINLHSHSFFDENLSRDKRSPSDSNSRRKEVKKDFYYITNNETETNKMFLISKPIEFIKDEPLFIRLKSNLLIPSYADNYVIPVSFIKKQVKLYFFPTVHNLQNGYITLENIDGKPLVSLNGRPEITLVKRRKMDNNHMILLSFVSSQNEESNPSNNALDFKTNITLPRLRTKNKYFIALNIISISRKLFEKDELKDAVSMKISVSNVDPQIYENKREPYICVIPLPLSRKIANEENTNENDGNDFFMYCQEKPIFFPIMFPNNDTLQELRIKIWFNSYEENIDIDPSITSFISLLLKENIKFT